VRDALTALYREVDDELRRLGASCEACGKCCRFADYGHVLWATNLEMELLRERHGRREAAFPGACAYLDGARCLAREGRALACRTFHCGLPREIVEEVTNRYFERIRELARAAGYPLEYDDPTGAQDGASPCTNP
jgi:Fe-S-cluster containining protein